MKLIAKTNFDLTTLFKMCEQFVGDSIDKTGKNPIQLLLDYNPKLASHFSYTFLTIVPTSTFVIVLETINGLHISTIEQRDDYRLITLTGSLLDWKQAITSVFTEIDNVAVNKLFEQAFTYFKNEEGLTTLWRDYNTQRTVSGLLMFTEK